MKEIDLLRKVEMKTVYNVRPGKVCELQGDMVTKAAVSTTNELN